MVELLTDAKNQRKLLHGSLEVRVICSTVLVIGTRAGGGEVLGAPAKGCNVVAIEKDEYQFNQLEAHVLQVKDALEGDALQSTGGNQKLGGWKTLG